MRLLFLTSSFPYGTGEAFAASEIRALAGSGIRVHVVPLFPRGHRVSWDLGTGVSFGKTRINDARRPALRLSQRQTVAGPLREQGLRGARRAVRTAARNLASAAAGAAIAAEVDRARCTAGHAYWASGPAIAMREAASRTGIPWTFTAHSGDIFSNAVLPDLARASNGVRYISEYGLAQGRHLAGGMPMGTVLHIGVGLSERSLPRRPSGPLRVLCPAALKPIKGHRVLLHAFRVLRERGVDARLLLAGEGPMEGAIRSEAQELGIADSLDFLGHVMHAELMRLYRAHEVDIVVLPSIEEGGGRAEGIPVSLMEAMAHRLPVVATRTGGIPELIDDRSGILVPPNDYVALGEALLEMASSHLVRQEYGENGWDRIRADFDIRATSAEFAAWIKHSGGLS